jgi:Prokaryotic homologs of the JAB domain
VSTVLQIIVPRDIQEALCSALSRAGNKECGGVLLGEHIATNCFAIRRATVQKPGAIASFVRRLSAALDAIKTFYKLKGNDYARFNYLGEWHSHPLFSTQPSFQDHATMRELVSDPQVGANFVVLLIFRLTKNGLEGTAHTYLPDGSIHPSHLDLEQSK